MNQADKEEAFALIARILHLTRPTPELDALRELITRQKPDEDGERWRFCLEHGFPYKPDHGLGYEMFIADMFFSADTPNKATDAARAAAKGTS